LACRASAAGSTAAAKVRSSSAVGLGPSGSMPGNAALTVSSASQAAYASPGTLGGHPRRVAAGMVNDPAARTSHEVDLAVLGEPTDGGAGGDPAAARLLAIGEAKPVPRSA